MMPYRKTYVNAAGNPDFKREDIPVCHYCGKPAMNANGKYFKINQDNPSQSHTKFCPKNPDFIGKPSDIDTGIEALKQALKGIPEVTIPILEKLLEQDIYLVKIAKNHAKQMRGYDADAITIKTRK